MAEPAGAHRRVGAPGGGAHVHRRGGPDLDLSNASGRMLAAILGEFDTMESEIKSERMVRQQRQAAESGKVHNPQGPGRCRLRCVTFPVVCKVAQPLVVNLALALFPDDRSNVCSRGARVVRRVQ